MHLWKVPADRGGNVGIHKALARNGGPQNDASSIEDRICERYANALVNAIECGAAGEIEQEL
eukprot:6482529-Amphidinium_carterae.10